MNYEKIVILWGLIGGVVLLGEDPQETACRECEEETGLTFVKKKNLNLLNVYGDVKIIEF